MDLSAVLTAVARSAKADMRGKTKVALVVVYAVRFAHPQHSLSLLHYDGEGAPLIETPSGGDISLRSGEDGRHVRPTAICDIC